jgi:Icc-related predicted phosphoesterase
MPTQILVLSDLHIRLAEAVGWTGPFGTLPEADVCVVAGDVCDGLRPAIDWVGRVIASKMPTVMVLGNHDLFGHDIPGAKREAPERARKLGIHLLDDSEAEVAGLRFVGSTLWTDFRLFESLPNPGGFTREQCMSAAKNSLADFDEIYATEPGPRGLMARLLNPSDTARYHAESVAFLDRSLALEADRPTVVVTHHAPYPLSIHQRFLDKPTSAAFASDLSGLIEARQPPLWIHGHVHDSHDYRLDGTRIVCNPRGYATFPNPDFDPAFVVEV